MRRCPSRKRLSLSYQIDADFSETIPDMDALRAGHYPRIPTDPQPSASLQVAMG